MTPKSPSAASRARRQRRETLRRHADLCRSGYEYVISARRLRRNPVAYAERAPNWNHQRARKMTKQQQARRRARRWYSAHRGPDAHYVVTKFKEYVAT